MIGQKEPIKFHSHNLPLRRRRRPSYCWSAVNVAFEDIAGNVAALSEVIIFFFHKIASLRASSPLEGYCEKSQASGTRKETRERNSREIGSLLAGKKITMYPSYKRAKTLEKKNRRKTKTDSPSPPLPFTSRMGKWQSHVNLHVASSLNWGKRRFVRLILLG